MFPFRWEQMLGRNVEFALRSSVELAMFLKYFVCVNDREMKQHKNLFVKLS